MNLQQTTTLLAACAALTAFSTSAQEQYYDFGFIGASGAYGQSVYSDNGGGSLSLEPNLFYNGEYGFVDGSLVNISVLPYLGISGQWRFAEVSDDFDDIPNGIDERDGNGDLGITIGTVGARLTYLHDVTNEHDGYEIQLHLGRTLDLPFEQFTLTPYVEVDFRDKKLSQHLYDISAQESAASGLNTYSSGSSWVYQTGLIGIYTITPDWLTLVKFELEHHDSDSPLIQRDLGWSVSLGVTYKFTE
ncbi:MipA/OmpV family protein [Vibrio coralliilyticus]|uniref:MipA/OmpV family protein n=1 Tax=Vibrio TaxID=662 RepID=UPI0005073E75|nr:MULTISPECIES: MipA/OmpV family protein [Vibrio]KFI09266.1 membrane protein [Vibrio sp. B183]NOI21457.1 MipA/OmpV family protein [Vibrio coralliilyticus]